MMIAEPNSSCRSRIRSRIWAWTVTSRAVVGSSAISSSGSLIRAIAIMARWRMPPENSCGYWSMRLFGFGMPTRPSMSMTLVRAAFLATFSCTWMASTSCWPIV